MRSNLFEVRLKVLKRQITNYPPVLDYDRRGAACPSVLWLGAPHALEPSCPKVHHREVCIKMLGVSSPIPEAFLVGGAPSLGRFFFFP